MRLGRRRAAGVALTLLLAASAVGSEASAQAPADPAVDFIVTPSRLELRTPPGRLLQVPVTVYNRSTSTLVLDAYIEDIDLPQNDLVASDELAFTASRWISFAEAGLEIPGGGSGQIMITADVPPATPTGGYHAFGFLQSRPQDSGTEVMPSGRIGVTLLLEVAPDGVEIERSARVSESGLEVRWNGLLDPEVAAHTVVDNTGAAHLVAGGLHTYRAWPASSSHDEKVGPHTTLRGARHRFESSWDAVPLFGKVTVTSELVYQVGPDELPVIVTQHTVWIIPWHLVAVVATLLALLIVVRRWRRMARRTTTDTTSETLENHEEHHNPDQHAPVA